MLSLFFPFFLEELASTLEASDGWLLRRPGVNLSCVKLSVLKEAVCAAAAAACCCCCRQPNAADVAATGEIGCTTRPCRHVMPAAWIWVVFIPIDLLKQSCGFFFPSRNVGM